MTSDAPRRVVFDTNTVVSAFLFPSSLPGQAPDYVLRRHRLLMSLEVAGELADVMRREKLDRYLNRRRREELVAGAIRHSEFIAPTTVVAACRDPKDDKVLSLAVDGNAVAIVAGDADLLTLSPFQGILILSPREFLAHFATA